MPSKDQSLFSKRLAAAGLDRIKLVGDQEPSPPLTAKSIQRQWSELRADEHCSGDLILQARGMCEHRVGAVVACYLRFSRVIVRILYLLIVF